MPYARLGWRGMSFIARAAGDPATLDAAVRREIRTLDASLAPYDARTMDQRRRVTTWPQRLFGKIFAAFGAIALVLAVAGVYGVMAYNVARRRREIGIRIALGARPHDVKRLVVGRGALLAGIGLVIGVAAALALTRLMEGLLWGVGASDPITFVAVSLLLVSAALLASYVPAHRAAAIDPMEAMRVE